MPFFNVDRRFGLLLIPKAASSAIHNAIIKSGFWHSEVTAEQFLELPQHVVFLREPHQRIESCYRMYFRTGSSRGHDLTSFPAFIRDICERPKDDPHILSQWWHTKEGQCLDGLVLKWDFAAMAKLLGLDQIPRYHTSDPSIQTDWDKETLHLFDTVYEKDIHLWNMING